MLQDKKTLDPELLWRAQNGDTPAFEVLVERYRDDLYAFALRMTRSEADALKAVQESFLSAYRHLSEFPGEAEFRAWIHASAASCALDRTYGATVRHLAIDPVDDAQERSLSPELRRTIEETTETLPRFQREVFLLKDVAGMDYDQIASITGKPIENIKTHLHQARLTLCERIGPLHFAR